MDIAGVGAQPVSKASIRVCVRGAPVRPATGASAREATDILIRWKQVAGPGPRERQPLKRADGHNYSGIRRGQLYIFAMIESSTLSPRFFELDDVRPAQGRSWIPLRQDGKIERDSPFVGIGAIREYTGIATLAVLSANRGAVDTLTWSDVDTSRHSPSVEKGIYRQADVHCDWSDERAIVGTRLVVAQGKDGFQRQKWHLHQDLVIALKLEREGDTWFRPDEGWIEVARLQRDAEGSPVLLEIRAEMLSDYLAARGMALYLSSYHERSAYFAQKPPYSWADTPREWSAGRDSRELYITDADFPPDPSFHFRGLGALWRTEWFEPGKQSIRVRGDPERDDVSFAAGTDGDRKTAAQCIDAMTYLAFKPTLVPALLHFRSGRLGWYSRDTGGITAADTGIHFGVNALGLVTIFAKDIAKLDGWEQRIWAAHSTPLDGGASLELFDAQMNCNPAATAAPEEQIAGVLDALDKAFQSRFGAPVLRDHGAVEIIIRRTHRFRAVEQDGLLALAKELNRLLAERIDLDALRGPAGVAAKEKLRELKTLERLVAKSLGDAAARVAMAPLFGINDLRNADAHLGSSLVASGKERAKITAPDTYPVEQGCQLLEAFVATVREVSEAIASGGAAPPADTAD